MNRAAGVGYRVDEPRRQLDHGRRDLAAHLELAVDAERAAFVAGQGVDCDFCCEMGDATNEKFLRLIGESDDEFVADEAPRMIRRNGVSGAG